MIRLPFSLGVGASKLDGFSFLGVFSLGCFPVVFVTDGMIDLSIVLRPVLETRIYTDFFNVDLNSFVAGLIFCGL